MLMKLQEKLGFCENFFTFSYGLYRFIHNQPMLLYMNCIEVNNAKLVVEYFTSNQEPALSLTFQCFFKEFYHEFLLLCQKMYFSKMNFARFREEELAYDAFNQGLLKFYQYIREKGFEERGYKIKTFFFEFCILTLLGSLKTLKREFARKYQGDPDMVLVKEGSVDDYDIENISELDNIDKRQKALLLQALEKISERCRKLIEWRKLNKIDKEEVAGRMGLAVGSVGNETYKCILRLKAIIRELDSNS